MSKGYVHGYDPRESLRPQDQAATLVELLHSDTACLVLLQARAGGNALIGRELYPLLRSAGFEEVRVSPRMVYVDSSKPELVEGFTKKTFTAMVEGVRNSSVANGLISEADFDRGIADLHRTAEIDGVFCIHFSRPRELNNGNGALQSSIGILPVARVAWPRLT